MTKPNNNSSIIKETDTLLYQTITWGILGESTESPHSKRVISYCIINPDFYATTDGHNIAFWTPHTIVKTFSIPATALFFFPKISNVGAYVRGSHQLHFISINYPFQIRIHPLHFSESKIYSFYYFKTTSTLVSAGEGILFTRVIIPPFFKDTQPMPETFQFEKISLFYEGIKFRGTGNPRFIENANFGIVLVNINDTIHIHTSNGTEVQVIPNLFITEHISSLSLLSYSNTNSLVLGTNNGNISILKFELPDPFVPNAPKESCKNVKRYKITNTSILISELFDRNFLVCVDFNRSITVFGIRNETIIQQFKCSIEAIGGFFAYDRLILFSQFMISIYHCSFFLTHFSEVGSNAIDIFRAVSETRSARIICTFENFFVSFFSPKDGKQIFGFTTGNGYPNIRNICYTRDVEQDGLNFSKRMSEDVLFCHLDQGITSFLHLDHIDRTNYTSRGENGDIFRSTISNFNMTWIPSPFHEDHEHVINQFVSFVDIGHEEVCGIVETGNAYIFSSTTNKLKSTFSLPEKEIICSIYSFTSELLVVSAIRKLFTFSLKTRRIVGSFDDCFITSLLLVDSSTLFCGCANGFVEIRNFPSLSVRVNSSFYNTCHTENGHRNPLQDHYLSTRQLYMNPSCVKKLDFCSRREIVMSLSSFGEIFLWDRNGKPAVRISIPFGVASACFLNGYGSILISSMETLFVIDWSVLFKKQLLQMQTPLDDFDLRIDSFDLKNTNNREPPAILTVADDEKFIFYQDKDDFSDDDIEFEELKVEVDSIPKRFFAPLNQDELDELNSKKKTVVPLQDIDEIIENERKLEAERNKKKKEPKEIKVKSRRGENSKRGSLFESKPKKSSKPSKYAGYYGNGNNDDDDEPRSSRRVKKKSKKTVKKVIKEIQIKTKTKTSLSLNSKSTYDRFNEKSKKIKKKNPRFEHKPEFSRSMQQIPTIELPKPISSEAESAKSARVFRRPENENKSNQAKKKEEDKKLSVKPLKKLNQKKVSKKTKKSKKVKKEETSHAKKDDEVDDNSTNEEENQQNDDSAACKQKEEEKEEAIEIHTKKEEDKEMNKNETKLCISPTTAIDSSTIDADTKNTTNSDRKEEEVKVEEEEESPSLEVVIDIPSFLLHPEEEEGVLDDNHADGNKNDSENSLEVNVSFDSQSQHSVHEPDYKRIHEPTTESSSLSHSSYIRQKMQQSKAEPQSFITEPNDLFVDIEIDDEPSAEIPSSKSSSSLISEQMKTQTGFSEKEKKATKRSRINRARAIDDEMFTSFRIDGFGFPFGGYTLRKNRGITSVGDNAPLVMVSSNNENGKRKKKYQKITKPTNT